MSKKETKQTPNVADTKKPRFEIPCEKDRQKIIKGNYNDFEKILKYVTYMQNLSKKKAAMMSGPRMSACIQWTLEPHMMTMVTGID